MKIRMSAKDLERLSNLKEQLDRDVHELEIIDNMEEKADLQDSIERTKNVIKGIKEEPIRNIIIIAGVVSVVIGTGIIVSEIYKLHKKIRKIDTMKVAENILAEKAKLETELEEVIENEIVSEEIEEIIGNDAEEEFAVSEVVAEDIKQTEPDVKEAFEQEVINAEEQRSKKLGDFGERLAKKRDKMKAKKA
ncbi:MAG: hypothetical protein K0R00_62 [Herbinix sp.]|jgi:hypothetical protein|nr:hypothetical protein [Herbinix sp.]